VGRIIKHVQAAIRANAPIIVVEYAGCGLTHPDIMDVLKNYKNFTTVRKPGWDGSFQVRQSLKKKWKITTPIPVKICGIYSDCCVRATANSLALAGYDVKVIEEACYSSGANHTKQIAQWEKDQNVRVIYKRRSQKS
jgi:hypothetical protein